MISEFKILDFVLVTIFLLGFGISFYVVTFFFTEKFLGFDSMFNEQTVFLVVINIQFIVLIVLVFVFIVLVVIVFVVFYICRQIRCLDYNRFIVINYLFFVNFFIFNEENVLVFFLFRLTREDRCLVILQILRDIISEEQGVKVYIWSGQFGCIIILLFNDMFNIKNEI